MKTSKRVAIIGGGISGLSVAFWLRQEGLDCTLLELAASPGGTIQTIRDEGWLIETGPNSALETTPLFKEMFDILGIAGEQLYANDEADKRYILRDGTLHPLPMSPMAFFRSSLWTTGGKLRLLKEPFIGRGAKEETIAEFVERRLGKEFLDYAINPFVAGVYAGDPGQLSVRAAFPKLYALEEKYGGLIKGMVGGARERKRRAEKAKDRAKMFSFRDGMQTFPAAIARMLGPSVQCNCDVASIARGRSDANGGEGFVITYKQHGKPGVLKADAVVLAVPAYSAAKFAATMYPSLVPFLEKIYYPPVAEVFLGFSAEAFTRPLDGFGYLIPGIEGRNTLGTIWSSVLFPGRAPGGYVALTTFVGGTRQPGLSERDDKELEELVLADIRSIMGATGAPVYRRINRWEKAIPQYNLGYRSIMQAIEQCESDVSGLFFCSNFRGGIALGDCVMSARTMASRVASFACGVKEDSLQSISEGA